MSSCKLYVNRIIIIIIIIIRCWSFGVDRKCIWLYNAKTKRSFRLFGKYKKIYIYIYILKKSNKTKKKENWPFLALKQMYRVTTMDFWYQIPLGGYRKLTPQGSATMHLHSQGSATAAKSRKTPRPDGWRSSRIRLHARYREWPRKESLPRRKPRLVTRLTTPRLKNVGQNRPSGSHWENSRQWRRSLTRKVIKNKVNNSNEF